MSGAYYRRATENEMRRNRWRLNRPVTTGEHTITAGTEVEIIRKFRGLTIKSKGCPTCGCSARAARVDHLALDQIFPGEEA